MLRIQMREFTLYIDWIFFNVLLPPVLSFSGLNESLLEPIFYRTQFNSELYYVS